MFNKLIGKQRFMKYQEKWDLNLKCQNWVKMFLKTSFFLKNLAAI